jgi:hypothetical protein
MATAALGTADALIEWRYFDLEAQPDGGVLAPQRGRISAHHKALPGEPILIPASSTPARESEQIRCRSACIGPA